MQKLFENYINSISSKFSYEETSEMGYRSDFENLLKQIFNSINNAHIFHDARAQQGNKPDFIVLKDKIPLVYLEVKDIGISLDKIEKSEQMTRYFGYANLVLTDYLEFRFYRNGMPYGSPIKIADYNIKNRTLVPISENYEYLAKTLVDFTRSHKEPIRSAAHLAKIMGGKGQRLRDNVRYLFDIKSENNDDLEKLYETIKKLLVNDLTPHSFADMYAQTLVYGLFVARFYDKTLDSFTRQEARELIPNSNRFLKRFFDHIIDTEFKSSLRHIVDELCEVFSHANVAELMKQYFKNDLWGEAHKGQDPIIHFYEDFLNEYDPELRKKMGAYYTPLPVVQFIVRSVDALLKKDFMLDGLADATKNKDGIHRVQILDPAVGTGTFLSETIEIIHNNFLGQEGRWPGYVHYDLLPRLHGFELMMTPYTIAHLKLGIELRRTGFWDFRRRLGIYLTNSLEESQKQQQMFAFGLAESIAEESKEAAIIKNQTPIMVVIGNPPYSGVSSNETLYANKLVEKYKVEPGGKQKLQERKHWLNDDYVKFIALAEKMVEKNGEGIMGLITNHSYLDNPTFRGMRWHLMSTFDEIYVLDLHGNSKKKEKVPGGGKDENVFDIQQGVAITIAIKKSNKQEKTLAKIYHFDSWGTRKNKFEFLKDFSIDNIKWKLLSSRAPSLLFVPEGSGELDAEYKKGFSVRELFPINSTGIVTMGDPFITDESRDVLRRRVLNFISEDISESTLKGTYKLGKNYAKWIIENKKNITENEDKIIPFSYRPFDTRFTYFDNKLVWRPRTEVMKNLLVKNRGLVTPRQCVGEWNYIFVTDKIADFNFIGTAGRFGSGNIFPLYLCNENGFNTPNLEKNILDKIEKITGKTTPEDIFNYIYGFLHSQSYRKKYNEFLKKDFPYVPYPRNSKAFKNLAGYGAELCSLHLLESPKVNKLITTYSEAGSDIVEKVLYKDNKVFINDKQYFGNVSESVWNFYVGGYQPAQKWLDERKEKILTNEDIEHYQKMIVALSETEKIMKKIDEEIKIVENS